MKYTEFKKEYATEHGISEKEADSRIKDLFERLYVKAEQDDAVTIPGYGTFKVVERAERKGRNPKTKEEIIIPASKAYVFKTTKDAKERAKNL